MSTALAPHSMAYPPTATARFDGPDRRRRDGDLLLALIDTLDHGLCVCGADGTLQAANTAARRELMAGTVLGMEHGRLVAAKRSQHDAFRAAMQAASARGLRRLLPLGMAPDLLSVCVLPLLSTPGSDTIALLLGRRTACSELALELMAGRHGLTQAERKVLSALLVGQRPEVIAAEHGVAISTIRTQIGAIRDKLGVDSVTALLIQAAGLPPVSTALRHGAGAQARAHW